MEYTIIVKEVWNQPYKVKAKNKKEAIRIIENGGGKIQEDMMEYNYTLDSDTWDVEQ